MLGRKRLEEGKRKKLITLRLRAEIVDNIKRIPGYNRVVESLIEKFIEEKKRKGD